MKRKFTKETKLTSPYEYQRKRLMRSYLQNYDSDPRDTREFRVTDGRLLMEIKWAGSISKWVSRQTDLVEVLEEIQGRGKRK